MIYHEESFEYEKRPHFTSTNDALVVTSVSIALPIVAPAARCSRIVHQ